MFFVGFLPKNHAGNILEQYVLFADPGGINTISRRIFPDSTSINRSHSTRWCSAGGSSGLMYSVNRARWRFACSCCICVRFGGFKDGFEFVKGFIIQF